MLLAFLNWLADAGVLAASIAAVGAPVPWRDLLFVYAVGTAVASAGVVPGGLGVVEGALALTLMGAGLRHPVALAAVLIYRLISFWMVISVGWLIYFLGPRTGHRGSPRTAPPRLPGLRGPLGDVDLRAPVLLGLPARESLRTGARATRRAHGLNDKRRLAMLDQREAPGQLAQGQPRAGRFVRDRIGFPVRDHHLRNRRAGYGSC